LPQSGHRHEVRAVVISGDGPRPTWVEGLHGAALLDPADPGLSDALRDAEVVLIDARMEAPLSIARRVRRLAAGVQLAIVATPDRARELNRAMLFTPGLGEPWVVTPEEADPDMARKAAEITRQRRSHARQLDRVSGRVARLQSSSEQTRRLSDQYLVTLLEMLPEPVFALDHDYQVLFANPVALRTFGVDPATADDRRAHTLLAPAQPQLFDSMLADADDGVVRGQLRLRGGDRGERIYSVVIATVPSDRPVLALVLHDVTDQVRAQEALAELAAQRTAVLGNIADGVILVGEDGRIMFANEAAARIHGAEHLGIPPDEWSDAYNLLTVEGDPYPPEDLPLARALHRSETSRDSEWLIRRPDGTVVHAQGSAAPVIEAGGRTVGAVLTVRDVTDQRRREAERERLLEERDRALAELQEAMRHRSRFYASMSHELRTPINAIIGYNELLTEQVYGPIPDEQRAALDRIGRAARHLLELVNDVLDLSKIEAGKLTIEQEPVRIISLVRDLEITMEPLARTHDVQLRFHFDAGCEEDVHTDPRRLRQILMNLLSNAIRYGAGKPVDVHCTRDDGLQIAVRDRGPGIAPERTEDIFDEFVQIESEDRGGTGLGLAISRALARAMGGDATVDSEPGAGSCFTVSLPALSAGGASQGLHGDNTSMPDDAE